MQLNPDKTPNSIFADIQQRKIGENAFNSSGLRWIKDVVLGKRNDSSFRTVVVGDPDLELSEIGIPCHIAESLQVSEYVNRQNREKSFLVLIKGFSLFPLFYSSSATCPYLIGAKGPTFSF